MGLFGPSLTAPGEDERIAAIRAVAAKGKPDAVPKIAAMLADQPYAVRRAASAALADVGTEEALQALHRAIQAELATQRPLLDHLVEGLPRFGERAAPILIDIVRAKTLSYGRSGACSMLGKMGARSAVEVLIAATRDGDAGVRGAACWSLGRIGDPRAVETLERKMHDGEASVRDAARDALKVFGWRPSTEAEFAAEEVERGEYDVAAKRGAAAFPLLLNVLWRKGGVGDIQANEPLAGPRNYGKRWRDTAADRLPQFEVLEGILKAVLA
jgi:HEAT repeat protein